MRIFLIYKVYENVEIFYEIFTGKRCFTDFLVIFVRAKRGKGIVLRTDGFAEEARRNTLCRDFPQLTECDDVGMTQAVDRR